MPYISVKGKNGQNICIGEQSRHHEENQRVKKSVLVGDVFFISLYEVELFLHQDGSEAPLLRPTTTGAGKIVSKNLSTRNIRRKTGF